MKLCLFLFFLIVPPYSYGDPLADVKRWENDIDFYVENLTDKHIDLFHSISKQEFSNELIKLKRSLSTMTTNQVLVAMMKLTHSIGDGHTSFPLWNANLKRFPFQLKMLDKALYVVKTTDTYQHLLGAKLESINNFNSSDVFQLFAKLTPFSENKYSTRVRVAQYIPTAELLNGLGIINDISSARFTFLIGEKLIELQLKSNDSYEFNAALSYIDDTLFRYEGKVSSNLWFGSSKNKKIIYVKFRRYTSMTKMASLAEDLLSFINDNKSEKLIIDLRDNYGGDFFVGLKLAQLLVLADSIDWKNGVFVLIDNVTFSAAMSNAAQFSQLLNAKLVGEPTGAKPSGYQDMGQFILPNSKLEVTYSKRLYHFKEDNRDALYPAVTIELSINDYIKKNDKQLNWVLTMVGWNKTSD
ncbi:MAG: peptidase S41 [Gammaproteobacteria bacterium]|nr:peptidase S41 [Gammaproteobacteria bacterium]